ncbi:hypothetical protein WJX84_007320 [Apatococcus fuscideae]|uniref:ABC transporter domain-containing protein n=1 Tax=Apatococcus fuscideae TaxID=2026836 RepID=A0AAW1TD27_9CHLO
MAAVMGPSGSGKSTMLDLLAGRKTTGELQGRILFAGQPPSQAFLRRYTGYVEQFDTLLAELTVKEMLMYTAELKRPFKESRIEKKKRVEQLLDRLALRNCQDTHIGDPMSRGVSGGQAKRTNVGIALITSPRVLFLDEPTSGLDSFTANEVMAVVKLLVKDGISICATIHCPPAQTFQRFDRIFLLQRGRVVFFGQNNAAAAAYFEDGFSQLRPLAPGENLAEYLVDVTTDADRRGKGAMFAVAYSQSSLKTDNDRVVNLHIEQDIAAAACLPGKKAHQTRTATTAPFWYALLILLRYRTKNNYMSLSYLGSRLLDKAIYTFLIFTFYWHVGKNLTQQNVPNIGGMLFFWCMLPAYGAGPYIPALVLERPVTVRERSDGLYTAFTYLLYKMVEELFSAGCTSVPYALAVYYLCELKGSFFVVWLIFYITNAVGISCAYMIAAFSPNIDVANAALPTYITALLFAAGYLLRWHDIPKYWIWLAYINWLWYAWGSLMINQFQDTTATAFGNQPVLQYYNLEGKSAWAFMGYEAIFFVVFFFLAWFGLLVVKWQRR